MLLSAVEVHDFRNLQKVVIPTLPRLTMVVGPNGSGKTNLLEALYALRMGRPMSGTSWRPAIRRGATSFLIRSRENDSGAIHSYGLAYDLMRGRRSTLDGNAIDMKTFLTGRPALFFGPDSTDSLMSSPSRRRALVDSMIFALWPGHYDLALRYGQILRRRNALLKTGELRPLEALDTLFIQAASRFEDVRASFIQRLAPHMKAAWKALRPSGASLTLEYSPPRGEALKKKLEASLEKDLKRRHTSAGPHRSDVSIKVDGVPFRSALSRGEAKVLVLALNLAFVSMLSSGGVMPLMLVDDLASELDEQSRELAWRAIVATGCQVVLTSLDDGLFDGARVFTLDGGALVSDGGLDSD